MVGITPTPLRHLVDISYHTLSNALYSCLFVYCFVCWCYFIAMGTGNAL